jgi:hypothetical protein
LARAVALAHVSAGADVVLAARTACRLLAMLARGHEIALGLSQTAEPERSDVVVFDGAGMVTSIAIKPARPASNWIWGCAAARVARLDGVGEAPELSVHLNRLCREGLVAGMLLGDWVDIGTPDALRTVQRG